MNNQERIIGIMGAMPEEINDIIDILEEKQSFTIGMRTYYAGNLNGIKAVAVFSRWGKVAAATTVSTLIHRFGISEIIFTGVAGAISDELNIGDIVIARHLVQHDLDGRPLVDQFEIPLLKVKYLDTQQQQLRIAEEAIRKLIDNRQLTSVIPPEELQQFNIIHPKLLIGDIASGDKFFSKGSDKNELLNLLPSTLCVEMEGAAVAQVCYEYEIPFTIIRTISDAANEQSHIDFPSFINKISNKYSVEIIKNIFQSYSG